MNAKFYSLSYEERLEFVNLVTRKYTEKRRSISLLEAPTRKNIFADVMKDSQIIKWLESHGCND